MNDHKIERRDEEDAQMPKLNLIMGNQPDLISAIMSVRQCSYEAFKHQIYIHEHIVQPVIRLFFHKEFAFDLLGL